MTEELKPCPFCGKEAEAVTYDTCVNFVGCTNHNCSIRTMHYYKNEDPKSGMLKAIEAWNKRE